MHANAVARLIGSFPVLVPPSPGLLCATGDLVADFRDEFSRTFIRRIDTTSSDEILKVIQELGREAKDWMQREKIPKENQVLSFNADMRYYRQGYEIPIEITPQRQSESGTELLAEHFNEIHEQFYGFRMEGTLCEIVNLRVVGVGRVPKPHLPEGALDKSSDASHAEID